MGNKNRTGLGVWLFTLMVLPFYKPGYFDAISVLDGSINALKVISAIIIMLIFLMNRKNYTITFVLFLLFELCFLMATLINGLSVYTYVKNNVLQVAIYMLFSMYSKKPREIIKVIFKIGEILTYINLATIIFFPDGLYTNITVNWMFGYKNYYIPFFWGFMIMALLYNYYEKYSIRPYILISIMIITLILVDSTTSLFIMSAFVGLIFILRNGKAKFFNAVTFSIINIVIYILIVVVRIIDLFSFLIIDIFQKNMTLSGRTRIWNSVISLIKDKPILGWGVMSMDRSISLIGLTTGTHAHNAILQYLYTGGVISLIAFILFNIFILRNLYKHKETFTAKVLTIALFLYYIGCLTETYSNALTYIMYALADNIEYMLPYENEYVKKKIRFVLKKEKV